MAGRLLYRDSAGREGSVEIGPQGVSVGRGLDCEIRTDDGMVSRLHSRIWVEGGRFVIEDQGSSNGTLVNNARVQKHALSNNDVVQCGSLIIRFIEDGAVGHAAVAAPAMRGRESQQPPRSQPVSQPLPYGGPPAMPGLSPGMPPSMQAVAPQPSPVADLPYGGPPAMPSGGRAPGYGAPVPEPSVFARGGPVAPHRDGGGQDDHKVMVDLGLAADASKLEHELKAARAELDAANANYEREVADSKRLRAEALALRDRIEEMRQSVRDREDQVAAHDAMAEELRQELHSTRDDLVQLKQEFASLSETLVAKERALGRANEDAARQRDDVEELNRQLLELARNKDEGWRKLNDQLAEIDQLREVINAQERMLEERRVGLISQEEVIKELRSERERNVKNMAQLKAERDEAATSASRAAAQIVALEEENRRLGRLMVEAQTDGRAGGNGAEQTLRLNNELKELRVELRRVEADRERLAESATRDSDGRGRVEARLAQLEVELQEAQTARLTAEAARNVAQDALAKAEVARHRAVEELATLQKTAAHASGSGDDVRREADKLRRRVSELEAAHKTPVPREEKDRLLREAEEKNAALERHVRGLQSEVDTARTEILKARAEAARARAAAMPEPDDAVREIVARAGEAFENINDILSDMRNNLVILRSELIAHPSPTVRDAVEGLLDGAETAKGALRGLRDLAEKA